MRSLLYRFCLFQAMIDVSSAEGWLATSLRCMHLVQMVVQGRWLHDCTLLTLPCIDPDLLSLFRVEGRPLECLPELLDALKGERKVLNTMLGDALSPLEITEVIFLENVFMIETFRECLFVFQNWFGWTMTKAWNTKLPTFSRLPRHIGRTYNQKMLMFQIVFVVGGGVGKFRKVRI